MAKYGIFTSKGDLIPKSDGGITGGLYKDLTKQLFDSEAVFYLSYKNGKTLLATIFDTQIDSQIETYDERRHSIVYLEEREWVLNPVPLSIADVRMFFKQAAERVENHGYVIGSIGSASHFFENYLETYHLKPVRGGDINQPMDTDTHKEIGQSFKNVPSSVVNLTLGRLCYGLSVKSKAEDSKSGNADVAIAYICTLTEVLRDYLKYGYTFAIAQAKMNDTEVHVSISKGMVDASINLDSMELTGNVASLPYFENAVKVLKTTSKKDIISAKITKETMPGWFIRQTLSSRGIMPKPDREKYRAFLNAESIQYDSKIFDDIDRAEEERERKRKAEEEARERRRKEEEERKAKAAAAMKATEKKSEEIPAEPVKRHKFTSPFGRKDKQKEDNKTIDSKNVTSVSKKKADTASELTTEPKRSPFGRKTSAKSDTEVSKIPHNVDSISSQKRNGKTTVPTPRAKGGNTTSETETKKNFNSPFVEQKEKSGNSEKKNKKSSSSKDNLTVKPSPKNKEKKGATKKKETKKEQDKKTEERLRTKKGKEKKRSKNGKNILVIILIVVFLILIATLFVIALTLGGYIPALEPVLAPLSDSGLNNMTLSSP